MEITIYTKISPKYSIKYHNWVNISYEELFLAASNLIMHSVQNEYIMGRSFPSSSLPFVWSISGNTCLIFRGVEVTEMTFVLLSVSGCPLSLTNTLQSFPVMLYRHCSCFVFLLPSLKIDTYIKTFVFIYFLTKLVVRDEVCWIFILYYASFENLIIQFSWMLPAYI